MSKVDAVGGATAAAAAEHEVAETAGNILTHDGACHFRLGAFFSRLRGGSVENLQQVASKQGKIVRSLQVNLGECCERCNFRQFEAEFSFKDREHAMRRFPRTAISVFTFLL